MQQQKKPGDLLTMGESFGLMYVMAKAYATCFTVFTRHSFGKEALGWSGLFAFILILFYGTFGHVPEMVRFWTVWLGALVIQRVLTFMAIWRGWEMHSQYGGQLWLGSLFGLIKSRRLAAVVEALACLGVGVLFRSVAPKFGSFVMGGAAALIIVDVIEWQLVSMQVQRMRDAEIEMRTLMDLYQGKSNDF